MRFLLIVAAAFPLAACKLLPGAGVVKIPDTVISGADIQSISSKYVNVTCSNEESGVSNTECPHPDVARVGSWIDVMNKCALDAADLAGCKTKRNTIIAELMLVIDHNFSVYEGNIVAGKAKNNFYSDSFRTSLETAATLFNPMSTVKILTGTAALTGTVQASANKEFYYDQAANALVAQMRADRKEIELLLLSNMTRKAYAEYPIPMAIRDLSSLYRAGTVASATITISEGATERSAEADKRIKELALPDKDLESDNESDNESDQDRD